MCFRRVSPGKGTTQHCRDAMLVKVNVVFFKSVRNVQGRRKGVARESHKTGLAERTGYAGKQMKISLVRWSPGRPKCTLEIKTEFKRWNLYAMRTYRLRRKRCALVGTLPPSEVPCPASEKSKAYVTKCPLRVEQHGGIVGAPLGLASRKSYQQNLLSSQGGICWARDNK